MSYDDDIEFIESFLENNSSTTSLKRDELLKLTKNFLNILYFDILQKNKNTSFYSCKQKLSKLLKEIYQRD